MIREMPTPEWSHSMPSSVHSKPRLRVCATQFRPNQRAEKAPRGSELEVRDLLDSEDTGWRTTSSSRCWDWVICTSQHITLLCRIKAIRNQEISRSLVTHGVLTTSIYRCIVHKLETNNVSCTITSDLNWKRYRLRLAMRKGRLWQVVDTSPGPPTAAPSIIRVDLLAPTFRCEQSAEEMSVCEHVNVIAGAVVGMVSTAKQPISWGCCYARSRLSLHDAIFNDEMVFFKRVADRVESANVSQWGQIFTDISVLFSKKKKKRRNRNRREELVS